MISTIKVVSTSLFSLKKNSAISRQNFPNLEKKCYKKYSKYQKKLLLSNSRQKTAQNISDQNKNQNSRLAPTYFSPNYKFFDQLLQTVKNETAVLNLVFEGFPTNINSTMSKVFCLKVPKNFVIQHFCVSDRLWYRKFIWTKKGGRHDFLSKIFCHTVPKNFVGDKVTILWFRKILVSKIFMRTVDHDFP